MPGPPPLISVSTGGVVVPSPFMQPPPPDSSFMQPPSPDGAFMQPPLATSPAAQEALLHYGFPSEADTLAYVDALKHSDLSDWRSLEEVARRAGAGSCSGAVTTSVLTALYLLGLFNLCAASPASCCVPPPSGRRRRRRNVDATLPPLLNNLQHNLSSLSLEQFRALPHVTTPDGGRVPLHISVVDKVRQLWDSNPRLLSSVSCASATQSVRSSFISLSGVASGIILAYSVAQLRTCYPDHSTNIHSPPKVWFFPVPTQYHRNPIHIRVIPPEIPVKGDDDPSDNCKRTEVTLGHDYCVPLLSTDVCPHKHWVLFNEEMNTGECVPRLCSKHYVYVQEDQLCHNLNEPDLCPGNRRLYVTASGMAVCDCPEGTFPGPDDQCYYLYEQAFCYKGNVMQFDNETKTLTCRPDPCRDANKYLWPDDLPYAPRGDGYCYQFNTRGPCKFGERFGFDTDKLEATCVSLEEAGLVQPSRGYMYQQMTFPTVNGSFSAHYQVSYVIKNSPKGATWDLEVKNIARDKRDADEGPLGVGDSELVVPFLDTREFPNSLEPLMKARPPTWVTRRQRRRRTGRVRRNRSSNATGSYFIDANPRHSSAVPSARGGSPLTAHGGTSPVASSNVTVFHVRHGPSSPISIANVSIITNGSSFPPASSGGAGGSNSHRRRYGSGTVANGGVGSSNGNLRNTKIATGARAVHRGHAAIPAGRHGSRRPGAPRRSPSNIRSSTNRNQGHQRNRNLLARLRADPAQQPGQTDVQQNATIETLLQEKPSPSGPTKAEMVRGGRRRRARGKSGQKQKRRKGEEEGETQEADAEENIERVKQRRSDRDSARRKNQEDIVKVDQTGGSAPIPVPQDGLNSTAKAPRGRGKKFRRRNRKNRGKKRRRGRGQGRKGRKKNKVDAPKNSTKTEKKKKKRKNPNLPYRVPTSPPPTAPDSPANVSSAGDDALKNRTRVDLRPSITGDVEDGDADSNVEVTDETSSSAGDPVAGAEEEGEGDEDGEEGEDEEEEGQQSSSSEMSLPKYMRHRGRRQSAGGIINAPELIQCKPGAEKDYNRKCRPRFIPQEKSRRAAGSRPSSTQPSIKCPENTSLNPLGQCQITNSALG
ncbi:uncharacterized protein LOC125045047 [Penaeus chinensis]|uniref:uncharacterized protein LOC125045047 n=1 Tax=Penaeus chinensis TaxID=139456 RepID=UPI001FB6C7FF|nr:uncharacterized protein LOC125045047 [Penaeus chinensis]XP_047498049.1 uncharacterized protein LOC125045047 [Penaeus chinensis]